MIGILEDQSHRPYGGVPQKLRYARLETSAYVGPLRTRLP